MSAFNEGHKAGASKSIWKTAGEIDAFVQKGRKKTPGEKLRGFLHEHLADLAEKWFKRGFRRGCIEAERIFKETGEFPGKVKYEGERQLFSGRDREISITWRSKKVEARTIDGKPKVGQGFKLNLKGSKRK